MLANPDDLSRRAWVEATPLSGRFKAIAGFDSAVVGRGGDLAHVALERADGPVEVAGPKRLKPRAVLGWHAVEDRVHVNDLHATTLRLFGLDHEKLTYRFQGRDFRLTDVSGKVVRQLPA
jgi:hypothetical protein